MSATSNAGRIGVWGASGSGKSYLVKSMIKGRSRVVVFDPLAEYGPLCTATAKTVDQVRQAMMADWHKFRIAFEPKPGIEPRELSRLCRLIIGAQEPYRAQGRGQGVTLVVEELNLSFPVGGGDAKCPGFAEVCSRGRHSGIEVFGLSQRIAEVGTRFRGNCSETYVLRQQGPRDLQAAADLTGLPVADIRKVQNREFIHEKAGQIARGKVK